MDKQRFINEVNTRCEFNKYNHIFATNIEPELAVVEAELRPESMNPLGMAHGGFVYFMRPSKGKKLRCEARIIKRGRTVNVVDTCVFDDSGAVTAKGTFEIYIME